MEKFNLFRTMSAIDTFINANLLFWGVNGFSFPTAVTLHQTGYF